jgi:hypothetical protein
LGGGLGGTLILVFIDLGTGSGLTAKFIWHGSLGGGNIEIEHELNTEIF